MNLLFALPLCLAALLQTVAVDENPSYSQNYTIFIKGAAAGTETVTESAGEGGSVVAKSQHELYLTDGMGTRRMEFETVTVTAGDSPVPSRYSCRYTSGRGDSYEVTVDHGRIRRIMSRNGQSSEANTAVLPGTIFLDFDIFHQYDNVARIYDFEAGGRQVFQDYIPVLGRTIALAVTRLPDSDLQYEGGSLPVRNFRVEFVGLRSGTFATDGKGRLVRLLMPSQELEVVRQDLLPKSK